MDLRPLKRLWLPKAGNSPEEYEDSSRAVYLQESSGRRARMAVSDGASESAFAKEWANALTAGFVNRPLDVEALDEGLLREWLAPAQREWHGRVPWERIPWHGEAKARAGAFATLLGVTVSGSSDGLRWDAMAVGDSCLFVVGEEGMRKSFPLQEAAQFGDTPALVCSNPANAQGLWGHVERSGGECAAGDFFFLASDALAKGFLAEAAMGERPWETLLSLEQDDWAGWVAEQYREGRMGNDDVTLLVTAVV